MISEINEWNKQLSDLIIIGHVHVYMYVSSIVVHSVLHVCYYYTTALIYIQNNAHHNKQSLLKKTDKKSINNGHCFFPMKQSLKIKPNMKLKNGTG